MTFRRILLSALLCGVGTAAYAGCPPGQPTGSLCAQDQSVSLQRNDTIWTFQYGQVPHTRQAPIGAIFDLLNYADIVRALGFAPVSPNNFLASLGFTPMKGQNNLSELSNPATARANLGLSDLATLSAGAGLNIANGDAEVSYGTTPGTAAQGNDGRIVGALQASNNLSDLSSASAARASLGLTAAATAAVTQSGAASSLPELDANSDLTAAGLIGATGANLLIAPPDTSHLTVFKSGPFGPIMAEVGGATPSVETLVPLHLAPPMAWSGIPTNAGLWENQAITGSSTGPTFYNSIIVNDQVADTSTQGSTPFYVEQNVSSAASTGPKNAIVGKFSLTAPSGNTSGVGGSYSPGQFTANASANDNGTGLTVGTSRGLLYGFNAVGELRSGATNFTQLSGGEVDCAVDAGATVLDNICMQVVGLSRHAVAGTRDDVMLSLNNQAGAAGFGTALEFGRQGGIFPVPNGTMIGATGNLGSTFTVANGIDFHLGIATSFWERLGSVYSVDGSGNVVANKLTLNGPLKYPVYAFASIPVPCNSGNEGTEVGINDSNTSTFGAVITAGGGSNHGKAYCNGTNWTFR